MISCSENDLVTGEELDDRLEVRGELIGPNGPESFSYVSTDDEDPYVGAGELPLGFGRPPGVSAVAYLTRRVRNPTSPAGGADCLSLDPGQPLDRLPGRPDAGTFFLEIATTQARTRDCLLDRVQTLEAIDNLTGELGTAPGQINFYLTADVDPTIDFIELYPDEYGQLTILAVDTTTGGLLGVPGAYVEFQITGGTVRQPGTEEVYEVTDIRGRLFFEYALR